MSLNQSIIKIRVALQNKNLKKSGKNKFAGFEYFELRDFLPTLNELMLKEEVNDIYTIENDEAILLLIKDEETNRYTMPFERFETPKNKQGNPSMQDIQYLGALNTYYKRYLYLNAFGITDGEIIDSMDNTQQEKEDLTEVFNDFQEGCKKRELDPKIVAKRLGLNKKSSKEKWLKGISQLDAIKQDIESWNDK